MNQLIGQFHPAIVHLPIGILCVALLFKVWGSIRSESKYQQIMPSLLGIALICCIASALSGYLLSLNGGYEIELANNHMWSGFALTSICAVLYVFTIKNSKKIYQQIAWAGSAILLFLTGHLGGKLTHGEDYLQFSLAKYQRPIIKNMDSALVYHDLIEPILADKCWSCHSSIKQKGGLRLDGVDHIMKGGKHGDIIDTISAQSKLYHRLTLPLSADEHMPPSGKSQPTSEEIKLIAWWIHSDVVHEKYVNEINVPFEIKSILAEMTEDNSTKSIPYWPTETIAPVDPNQLATINKAGIAVIPIAQNSNFLKVILSSTTFKSSFWSLLKGINKNVVWLSAKNIHINDTALETITSFDHLIKLDLSQSSINDESIAKIATLHLLKTLNLNATAVTDKGLSTLSHLSALQSIYLYQSKANPSSLNSLKQVFPHTILDTGNYNVPIWPADTTEYTYTQLAIDKKANISK